jgi:hypothetical protein
MRTALFLFCLFGATAAFGQAAAGGALSAETSPLEFPAHPKQAVRQPMGIDQDLRGQSGVTSAQGTRPLWEVAPKVKVVPLGDVARELRKRHEIAPKSEVTWEN